MMVQNGVRVGDSLFEYVVQHYGIEKLSCKNIYGSFVFDVRSKMFSVEKLGFNCVPDKYGSSKDFSSALGGIIANHPRGEGTFQNNHNLMENKIEGESGGINSFCSDVGFFQGNIAEEEIHREQQLQLFSQLGSLDDLYFDIVSPPLQPCHEEFPKLVDVHSDSSEVIEPKNENPTRLPSLSLQILNNYGSKFRWFNDFSYSFLLLIGNETGHAF
ncbi:unnamed protein product [Ilex paraguariensis]|uniref:Uncharacterized protein n=1 Tax=Ilex paraguariensis TaxID=185542 RepID=A0ABC8RL09_9AQUA